MVHTKNYKTTSKFVKVMPRNAVASFFSRHSSYKFPRVYMCQKLWKLASIRQVIAKISRLTFLGPPCIHITTLVMSSHGKLLQL